MIDFSSLVKGYGKVAPAERSYKAAATDLPEGSYIFTMAEVQAKVIDTKNSGSIPAIVFHLEGEAGEYQHTVWLRDEISISNAFADFMQLGFQGGDFLEQIEGFLPSLAGKKILTKRKNNISKQTGKEYQNFYLISLVKNDTDLKTPMPKKPAPPASEEDDNPF